MRDIELKDLIILEKIHAGSCSFPMPNLNDDTYIVQKAIEVNDELKGAIIVRVTSEISLILDKDLNPVTRAKVIKSFVEDLRSTLINKGLRDTHLFISEDKSNPWLSSDTCRDYANLLIKHFGFVPATGIPLYYEVK